MDAHIISFSSTTHAAPRDSWLLHFYTDMEHQKLVKSKKVFFRACVFLFELAFVNRNYKTRKFYTEVNNYTTSKASNIIYMKCKRKRIMKRIQTHSTVVVVNLWLWISKLKYPYHAILFSKACQNYLLLNCLETCQTVLIWNIRVLTFSFITTTLHDVLNKKRYQQNLVYIS